jgi:hypothetical protein
MDLNLPNYFLADMPAEAELTQSIVTEACRTLKHNRERFLEHRSTAALVEILTRVGNEWRDPNSHFRKLALHHGPAALGFSRETLARGLDSLFAEFTTSHFEALLNQDLGHHHRLDNFAADSAEQKHGRMAHARGAELVAHITAGNLPNPAIMSMVCGFLTRSAQFVKCATGASLLPRLFAHSVYQIEPKLGACLELAEWRGGSRLLEEALFSEADLITGTGSDEALREISVRVPHGRRFLGYGHKVSFAYVSAGMLGGGMATQTAKLAAADVSAWNQLGCLSPHVIYVQDGGLIPPSGFASLLADELSERELSEPRGSVPVEVAAAIASRRSIYQLRAAASEETRIWTSPGSTAWTVVWEADARFQLSCLHRFIYVKTVKDLTDALQHADLVRGKVSTVGLAVPPELAQDHARELARWGAARVCPLGRMQRPPLAWRHDGRPALGDLLLWTDLET